MTRQLIAALALIPLLAAPALAVPMMPKVKASPAVECVGQVPADCAQVLKVGRRSP